MNAKSSLAPSMGATSLLEAGVADWRLALPIRAGIERPIERAQGLRAPDLAASGLRLPGRAGLAMAARGAIRRLWPSERLRVRDHLLRLDAESRRLRFAGQVGTAQVEAHCAGVDWRRGVLVGYVAGGAVRGLGELLPMADGDAAAAELAVSVEPLWQNRGIGTLLLRRLIIAARNRLITRLYMVCLLDNGRVLRLARRFGGEVNFDRGEAQARIEPPRPTFWTVLAEALDAARPPFDAGWPERAQAAGR